MPTAAERSVPDLPAPGESLRLIIPAWELFFNRMAGSR